MLTSEDVSDDEMVRLYNQAEVYVNLSDKEGFGYAPLEAMNCGCAVVSTPCSEYLLDGVNCATVPFESTTTDTANRAAALLADRTRLVELTSAGYETAHKFDFRNVVDAFLSAIQSPTSLLPKATVFVSIGDENGVEIEEAKFG
jgi:glycosyltransferase involved in cell wall biosynthesis